MTQVVNRSRDKHAQDAKKEADGGSKPPEKDPKTPDPAPAGTTPATPAEPPKLTDLLGSALRYGSKGAPKPPAPPPAAAPPAAAAPATPPAEPPAPVKKGAKGKKPALDTAAIVTAATTAATEAALRTVGAAAAPAATPDPLEHLADEDRRDIEIATHLAKMDPRYKDAPQILLGQLQQAEDYASRWEAANPGKMFDPKDEEHNEFYAGMRRPWSDAEFDDARVDLRAERKVEQGRKEQSEAIAGTQADVARMELAPAVDQAFTKATLDVAKLVGDEVHGALTKGGWDELHKADPVLTQVLAETLSQVHPFVEAAIQIDDPRQRIRIDPKNPAHAQWNHVVNTGEAALVGHRLDDGRVFARRADYARMTPAQQRQHWFLTTDDIIQGALDFAAKQVKATTEATKNRLTSMGFVRQNGAPAAAAPAAPAPNATPPAPPAPAPAPAAGVEKPVSPTVGGGAKIDDTGGAPKSKEAQLLHLMSQTLRGA